MFKYPKLTEKHFFWKRMKKYLFVGEKRSELAKKMNFLQIL